jgi:oligopeptide/dipeptide ABC transporter ATP-binding protein
MGAPIFEITDLDVHFSTPDGDVHAVKKMSLGVGEAECLGVVGESGSGKSQLFLAAIGLLSGNGRATGSVKYRGEEILGLTQRSLNRLRGSKITMIFQDPLTSLTPHMTVGAQIMETLRVHQRLPKDEAEKRALEVLDLVRIPEGARRMRQYPHELSGGMRQRVMIAMGMVCGPDLLIADEPTTALDVTVQAEILDIMRDLKAELKTSIVLVSHDMGVIAGMADRVAVMRGGEIVESGKVDDIFYKPQHDYTKMLLEAMPRLDRPDAREHGGVAPLDPSAQPILKVEDLRVHFPVAEGWGTRELRAVDGVSFTLRQGEALGIVGESGCGKTMLSRAILQLLPKRAKLGGRVVFDGRDLVTLSPEALRRLRGPELAVVFQDPMTSLNPVLTIGTQLIETMQAHLGLDSTAAARRGAALLAEVGIPAPEQRLRQYPHQLSGGMRQRVAIAIALSCEPKLLIADEPTTALDVTIQAQILDLLAREQRRRHMAMILITHDLGVVAGRTDEVAVMYAGRVVERASTTQLFANMRMPYTAALLAALPKLDSPPHTPLPAIAGRPPDPTRPLPGCSFAPRCRYADELCQRTKPALTDPDRAGRLYACWHPLGAASA